MSCRKPIEVIVPPSRPFSGFTLIEMSIVLVIIGLIVGGILAGQDLIQSAKVRAQIAQIEKYNTAVNTFRGKYGALPGDLLATQAGAFGFITNGCDSTQGKRDGNGILDGWAAPNNLDQFIGEVELFWEDLSTAGLIDGTFPGNGGAARDCTASDSTQITLAPGAHFVGDFIPAGKIEYSTYLYAYQKSGKNWFGLSAVTGTDSSSGWTMISTPSLPVSVAYRIDSKTDDGLPTTGRVIANYSTWSTVTPAPNNTSPSPTTCWDTTSNKYSTSISEGSNADCTLSFQFQ